VILIALIVPTAGISWETTRYFRFHAASQADVAPLTATPAGPGIAGVTLPDAPRDPWSAPQSMDDHPHLFALRAYFDALRRDVANGHSEGYARHFDTARLMHEVQALDQLPALHAVERAMLNASIEAHLARSMRRHIELASGRTFRITRIEGLPEKNDCLVYTCAVDWQGRPARQRWWLRHGRASWRAYDVEHLDVPIRMTTEIGAGGLAALGVDAEWARAFDVLIELVDAMPMHISALDVGRLQDLSTADFPTELDIVRRIMLIRSALARGQAELAAVELVAVTRIAPDTPILHALRARLRDAQGRPDAALREAEAFIDRIGDDPMMQQVRGRSLLALHRPKDAADAFRAGLATAPTSVALVAGLGVALDGAHLGELERYVRALPSPELAFEPLAMHWLDAQRYDAIDVIARIVDEAHPNHPVVAFYRAQAHGRQGSVDEAIAVLRSAVQYAPGIQRPLLDQTLRDALVIAGRPLEAYRSASDSPMSFRTIAHVLVEHDKPADLEELIAAHAEVTPDDPWLSYYTGELHLLLNAPNLAIDAFERGLSDVAIDDSIRPLFEDAMARALYGEGMPIQAYRRLGGTRRIARTLAQACINDRRSAWLRQLIDVHSSSHPDDRVIHLWLAHAAWLDGQYDRVLDHLADVNSLTADDDAAIGTYDNLLVRSLLRLDRLDDAMVAAREATRRRGDPFYEAIVHAFAGDVGPTVRLIERCVELGHQPQAFYDDFDLGPVIAGPQYAALHQMYPSTAIETGRDAELTEISE